MTLKSAINIAEQLQAGLAPPTQLAPYQDMNYMLKYWDGDRTEYKPKKSHLNKTQTTKRKKKSKKKKKYLTTEQYGAQKTRDVAPNYLNRALSPFFQMTDEPEYKPKKDHLNKPPKKRKKNDRKRTRRT